MSDEMTVVSFRIPKILKKRMKGVKTNWSKEVRDLIEKEVKKQRKKKALDKIVASMKNRPTIKAGTADRLVREDRDSN